MVSLKIYHTPVPNKNYKYNQHPIVLTQEVLSFCLIPFVPQLSFLQIFLYQ
nr:MAG TPA: hypothetical protein [Caudoviricetes sp.]